MFLFFFFNSKWWNVYSVSIISSDCTLKNPNERLTNQTLFFLFKNVLHPRSIFNHGSVLYWNVWVYFFAAAAWCVSAGCGSASCTGRPERWECHSSPRVGAGSEKTKVPLLLIYQQNLLLLLVDWNICCTKRGRGEAGNHPLLNTETDFTRKPDGGQIHWPFPIWRQARWFSHRSNRLDTTMRQHNKVHIWA